MDPTFSTLRLSLLDRGFVFAIAHVRGGGEMGRPWYEDGKELTKTNTFPEFIACDEHHVAQGLTTPERLVARGGVAGGCGTDRRGGGKRCGGPCRSRWWPEP